MGTDSRKCGLTGLTYLTSANMRIADRTRDYQAQQHKRHRYTPISISPFEPSSGRDATTIERNPVMGAGVTYHEPYCDQCIRKNLIC